MTVETGLRSPLYEMVETTPTDYWNDSCSIDELTYAIKYGWIPEEEIVSTLRDRPGFQHVVVTGRDAPQGLVDAADLVSEVVKVKHPMDAGIRAQQGIEW